MASSTVSEAPATAAVAGRRLGRLADRGFKYWAVAPALAVVLALAVYPAVELLYLSAGQVGVAGNQATWTFAGAANLQTMLRDPVVPAAFRNTVVFVAVVVAVEGLVGLALAVLVSRAGRIGLLYRAVLVVPILVPPIAVGTIWKLLLDYNYGLVDQVLRALRLPAPTWLADPSLALPSVMIVDVWHWTSFFFLVFLAAVESLPRELLEAARIDGAGEWRAFRHVLLPLLLPVIAGTLALRTIFAFKVFDEIFVLTSGGPGTASQVISMYIYQVFFVQFRTGYGALLAVAAAMLTTVFVIVLQRVVLPRTVRAL